MKVLVTGAAGMLGQDVVRAAEFVNHEVVGYEAAMRSAAGTVASRVARA